MSKSRIKINLPTITTRDEAEFVMNELALAENNRRKLLAIRDGQVLAINSKYEAGIAACAEQVKEKSDLLRAWAETYPEAFPKNRKSIEFVAGTLGFRTGTPKLTLLSRAWTWEKVLAEAMHYIPNFIRSKPELDKEAIIAQREELSDALPKIGVKVTQAESFFVEPALTDTAARQVALN